MGSSEGSAPEKGSSRWGAALGLVLLALLPSLGTWRTPWIADDAAILAQAPRSGPWVDWTRAQYGMQLVRFWRPVVSMSWAWQEAWTGIDPLALRSLNLALHAACALLAWAAARRLGCARGGALASGAWVALFPAQGGTVVWLAGRTDLLVLFFLLATLVVALGRRPLASAPLAFLACASKEFGVLAPAWVFLLAAARGESGRAAARRAAPALVAVAIAALWRRLALGVWIGGYPAAPVPLASALAGTVRALGAGLHFSWPLLGLLAGLGFWMRCAARRGFVLALAAAGLALVPLLPLVQRGPLEAENLRLWCVVDAGLALAAGFLWSRPAERRAPRALVPAAFVLALGLRLVLAWSDAHDWARAGELGEEEVARARAVLARAAPSGQPVLFTSFDPSAFGAYCLGFGCADRFRAPFPASPRPAWPWRLLFVNDPARARAPLVAPRADGSLWPLDDARPVSELALLVDGEPLAGALVLDRRALHAVEDRSPRLALRAAPSGAPLEVLIATELGYEPVPLGTLDGAGAGELTLMQLLARTNGVAAVNQILAQAADVGARRAYLELRALDASGAVLAATPWIELGWPPELLAYALSAR